MSKETYLEQVKVAAFNEEIEKIAISQKMVNPIIAKSISNLKSGIERTTAEDMFKKTRDIIDRQKKKYPTLAGDRATPMIYSPLINAIKLLRGMQ